MLILRRDEGRNTKRIEEEMPGRARAISKKGRKGERRNGPGRGAKSQEARREHLRNGRIPRLPNRSIR
jgi:hypothetical protein